MSGFVHIGLDDTDSLEGGCTTYIASLLIALLSGKGIQFADYPSLVRLNPNIPWKTRGNGAVCIKICVSEKYDAIKELIFQYIEENSDLKSMDTNPGIVLLKGEVTENLKIFSQKALYDVLSLNDAIDLLRECKAEALGLKTGRGIIGALAAIGQTFDYDHTYEVLTYRIFENRGKPRKVTPESVFKMNEKTQPLTFSNIDAETNRILITPRGPDPVLFGIRGESPESVKAAMEMISIGEPVERWILFRTNQGTDAHLRRRYRINEIKSHVPLIIEGRIASYPKTIIGGHVIFELEDQTGRVDCAAYEPTGSFRNIIKNMIINDVVRVYGGTRKAKPFDPITVNMEKIEILNLAPKFVLQNPKCPNCNKTTASMGLKKGFRCENCGYRNSKMEKLVIECPREIRCGSYIPPTRAHRHLTKPFERYGLEKRDVISFLKSQKSFWGEKNDRASIKNYRS